MAQIKDVKERGEPRIKRGGGTDICDFRKLLDCLLSKTYEKLCGIKHKKQRVVLYFPSTLFTLHQSSSGKFGVAYY
jgi:hypothetical protein